MTREDCMKARDRQRWIEIDGGEWGWNRTAHGGKERVTRRNTGASAHMPTPIIRLW